MTGSTQAHGRRRAKPYPHVAAPADGRCCSSALLVVGVLGTAAWVLLGSRLLVARHIDVVGARLVPRDRVLAVARVRLGEPLIRLDTGAVRDRVEAVQEVETVRVERRWPATVRIVVTGAHADRRGAARQPLPPDRPVRRDGAHIGGPPARPSGAHGGRSRCRPIRRCVPALAVIRDLAAVDLRTGSRASRRRRPRRSRCGSRRGSTVVWGAPERAGGQATVAATGC